MDGRSDLADFLRAALRPHEWCADILDVVDEHHGFSRPGTGVRVVGCMPSRDLVERLKGLGLTDIEESSDGFIARGRLESSARDLVETWHEYRANRELGLDRVAVVNHDQLGEIENALGFALPAFYRRTALAYPFPPGSFADEFMLLNRPAHVIGVNAIRADVPGVERPFFVGTDGGEECFFVDAANPDSPVYVFELETGRHRILKESWTAYLDEIAAAHEEIAADRRRCEKATGARRWWQFWK